MFVDKATITVKAGKGGNGAVAFHREKYVSAGGPSGGDGGRGGDVIFVADTGVNTLVDFRYRRFFAAEAGGNGLGKNCSGKSGKDLTVRVPVGTIVREAQSGRVMADLTQPGQQVVLAKGGRGGRGNQHFATPTRQAPKFSEDGKPGKTYDVSLELKLIADAGIIGFPNAGKSTLLSMVTNAKPKIAGYQFTTLSPNLGVVRGSWGADFVLADIPGLVEGASQGIGLGHDFLRHIERTKVLIHMVDAAGMEGLAEEGGDPAQAVTAINEELRAYNPELLKRPQIIVANKMDLIPPEEAQAQLASLRALAAAQNWPIFAISAASNQGLQPLMQAVSETLAQYPEDIVFNVETEAFIPAQDAEAPITIEKDADGLYRVEGPGIERILGYTNMQDERGFAFFQRFMREKGIIARLEELGIVEGDTVQMYELQFDYYP